jgi:tRNA (cytidine/uridine-2'-O-)-methyltransferase
MLRLALVEPEIPWNAGNVGRTCLAAGAELHLVGKLGFSLSERRLKRAGLDYWERLTVVRHETIEDFLKAAPDDKVL